MTYYNLFIIIFFFSIIICNENTQSSESDLNEDLEGSKNPEEEEERDWSSPCENTKNPKSFEDCTHKSTEFIEEICCYLKGAIPEYNDALGTECIDINRDDARNQKILNLTKAKIKNGTYWEEYNKSYVEIETIRCSSKHIFPKIILIFYLIFYLIIF